MKRLKSLYKVARTIPIDTEEILLIQAFCHTSGMNNIVKLMSRELFF